MKPRPARGRRAADYAVKAMKSFGMAHVFRSRRFAWIIVPAAAAVLAGCANMRQASRRVEDELAGRGAKPEVPLLCRADSPETRAAVGRLLAEPLTADRAARIALVSNRRLRASLATANFAEADLWQAACLPNPDVSGSLRFPSGGGPVSSTVAVGFNAFDALLIPLRKKLAAEALDAAERRAADDALVVIAQTHAAWHTSAARLEWRACLRRLHEEDDARAKAAGRGPLAAAHDGAQAAESGAELARLDAQLAADRERVNVLLGLEGEAAKRWTPVAGEPPVPSGSPNADALERIALQGRLDLAAARTEAALVRRAFELKRQTRFLPVGVEVGVESEREHSGDRLTGPRLKLGLPIFDQGQAELLRLRTASEQAEDRAAALRVEICADVRAAAASVEAARRVERLTRENQLGQARRIWAENLRQAGSSGSGPLAMHAARRGLEEAERLAIEVRRDYWLARTNLARALGGAGPKT